MPLSAYRYSYLNILLKFNSCVPSPCYLPSLFFYHLFFDSVSFQKHVDARKQSVAYLLYPYFLLFSIMDIANWFPDNHFCATFRPLILKSTEKYKC